MKLLKLPFDTTKTKPVIKQEFAVPWVLDPKIIHSGIDFGLPRFTPVLCQQNCDVLRAWYDYTSPTYGWGNTICFDFFHESKAHLRLYLAHNDGLFVREGFCKVGTVVANSGTTGSSTGPHMHLELREVEDGKETKTLNPHLWFEEIYIANAQPEYIIRGVKK